MNHRISILFLFIFLSLSFFSEAIEIKKGYWVGISQKQAVSRIATKFEEWNFGKDTLTFRKYDEEFKPSFLNFSGKYELINNELIVKDDTGEILTKLPILIQEDQIIITATETSTKIFLYYNGEKSEPQNSIWESALSNRLFSISRPELFVNAAEIEFWDYASFYSKDQISQCHHKYYVFQFGEQHFITFDRFPPLRIKKKEADTFTIEFVSEKRELVILKPININPLINMDDLVGKWKWKESGIKPNNINNHYTISIGYNMHVLNIEKDGFIQWHTELYFNEVQKKDPAVIPNKVLSFSGNSFPNQRKKDEAPFIKICPTGRLIIFESYPMESSALNIGTTPVHHSQIMALQFLEKSNQKILFKKASLEGNYITFTSVSD